MVVSLTYYDIKHTAMPFSLDLKFNEAGVFLTEYCIRLLDFP